MRIPIRAGMMAAASLLWLAGCAVGPDFKAPDAPDVKGYTPADASKQSRAGSQGAVAAQQLVRGGDIPEQWWTLFHSEALNQLVHQAIRHNPDLEASRASLRQARENVRAAGGTLLPRIDAGANVSRQKISFAQYGRPGTGSSQYTLYNASVDVAYDLDVFGGTRRQIESLQAAADEQRFRMEAAWLTVTSNVVTAALREASLRAQIQATRDIIAAEKKQAQLLQRQYDLGGASRNDLLAQQTRLAQTRATLPPLQKQLAQVRNLLAALAGRFPEQQGDSRFELGGLQLPGKLPLSLPSKLVEQRPDIRAAAAQLHAASARVGVATANMLPQLTLTGSYGTVGTQPGQLFGPGSMIWNAGAGLLQPLFRGGELRHRRKAAIAAFDQAAARYRSTVLTAFRNVADALRALESDTDALAAQAQAQQAAKRSLELGRRQFEAGAINYLALLDAQRTYQQTRIAYVQAEAGRYADTAALFQALGGGWWHRNTDSEAGQ